MQTIMIEVIKNERVSERKEKSHAERHMLEGKSLIKKNLIPLDSIDMRSVIYKKKSSLFVVKIIEKANEVRRNFISNSI